MPLNDKSVDKNGHTLTEQSHGVSEISASGVIAAMTTQEDRQELKAKCKLHPPTTDMQL